MKEKGMGRTRLGRFAAITVPATAATVGFGVAIMTGNVSAALASSTPFEVTATQGQGSALELSLQAAQAANTAQDAASADKDSAFVSLMDGQVSGEICLAAIQPGGFLVGDLGLKVNIPSTTIGLGAQTDLNLTGAGVDANLPATQVGVANTELEEQTTTGNTNPGGFGIDSGNATPTAGDIDLANINANLYSVSVGALNGVSGISVAVTDGNAAATDCAAVTDGVLPTP